MIDAMPRSTTPTLLGRHSSTSVDSGTTNIMTTTPLRSTELMMMNATRPKSRSKLSLIRPRSRHQFGYAQRKHHGEDAVYCDAQFQIVADGVGGTAISSAKFAKLLVRNVSSILKWNFKGAQLTPPDHHPHHDNERDSIEFKLREALKIASKLTRRNFDLCEYAVAAALNVAFIEPTTKTLHVLSVGDTKTVVVRRCEATQSHQVVFETTSSVRDFNSPNTICSFANYSMELNALYESFALQKSDVVLTFSDGVTDNLFQHEIVDLVAQEIGDQAECADAQAIAKDIVAYCFQKAQGKASGTTDQVTKAKTGMKKLLSFQFLKSHHDRSTNNKAKRSVSCSSIGRETSPFALSAALELKKRMEMHQSASDAKPFPEDVVQFVESMAWLSGQTPMLNKEFVFVDSLAKEQAPNSNSLNGLNGVESLYSAQKLLFIAHSRMFKPDDTTLAVCIV